MESIEIWMWLIAGLIIAGALLVGGLAIFSNYTHDLEIENSLNNFNLLKNQVDRVCLGGLNNEEIDNRIFSYYVERIWVENNEGLIGIGNNLCVQIKDESTQCKTIDVCSVNMQTINLDEKTNVFYLIQKALGKKKVANIKFDIIKTNYSEVSVNWQRQYVE